MLKQRRRGAGRAQSFEGRMTAKTVGGGGGVLDRDNMVKSHSYFSFTPLCIRA